MEEALEVRWNDRVVYSRAHEYNCLGQLLKISEQLAGQPIVTRLNYTRAGHLHTLADERATWTYSHDANGNVASVNYGLGSVGLAYEYGERIAAFGDSGGAGRHSQVVYANDTGNMIRRAEYDFVYNDLDQLVQIWRGDVLRQEIRYDARGRPVRLSQPTNVRSVSLLYMLTDKPWLLTHVVEEGEGGRAMRLTYDKTDQLISMEVGDRLYAVVTTNTGTPTILLESGMIPP
jgi:YD repeat-containing protein